MLFVVVYKIIALTLIYACLRWICTMPLMNVVELLFFEELRHVFLSCLAGHNGAMHFQLSSILEGTEFNLVLVYSRVTLWDLYFFL